MIYVDTSLIYPEARSRRVKYPGLGMFHSACNKLLQLSRGFVTFQATCFFSSSTQLQTQTRLHPNYLKEGADYGGKLD